LFEIAQRNPDLKKEDLPTGKAELLAFISVERRRELFQEGHRYFDMRRTGELMTRVGGNFPISNWDVSKFVFPIPANEINASGLEQNTGWSSALPPK
ncbi:MAG: RagB/SusD family nutrient uptake outer membrane protein, partial [Tannerellaceae bacterium]|nr:RagB/SusD family nutrient uptake outer membrane protein [Tannerellaceae bacterium]